jgi:hypothetical protein
MKLESLKEFQLKNEMSCITGGEQITISVWGRTWVGERTQLKDQPIFNQDPHYANSTQQDFIGTLNGEYFFTAL